MDISYLKKDLEAVLDSYPKLSFSWNKKHKYIFLSGDLDICDVNGDYWETFNVLIVTDWVKYPHSVPSLIEKSKKLPRNKDRHISEEGICCVEVTHILLKEAQNGISFFDFLTKWVYPFFANQLYYEEEKDYANGDWKHDFDGIFQFYQEELNLKDPNLILSFLEAIVNNLLPKRNALCLCGQKKSKRCHHNLAIDFLSMLPKEQLLEDINGFRTFPKT